MNETPSSGVIFPVAPAGTPASCPHCGSEHAVRAGKRKLKSGVERQLYRCARCHRRYSTDNRAGKHTDPEAMLRALALACRGYRYPEILHALQAEFRLKRSKAAVSRSILDYKPGAAAEKPDKVCTQLTLYAHALALRAGIPLKSIQCGWFDERDAWFFDPVPLAPPSDPGRSPPHRPKRSPPRSKAASPYGRPTAWPGTGEPPFSAKNPA